MAEQSGSAQGGSAQGWRSFFIIWFGQVVSMLGSGLTHFGLGIWVYEKSGSATLFALIYVCGSIPGLLIAPIAGTYIDRWDRRWVMILSDAGTAVATIAMVLLLLTDHLEIGFIYVVVAVGATFMSFQIPAFTAAISLMVPKEHLGRASGMLQFGPSAARILAPLLAGLLLPIIELQGLVAIDLVTFVFAVVMTFMASIPRPPVSAEAAAVKGSVWREAGFGWRYIVTRPGLLALLGFFAVLNLLFGFSQVLTVPMVLSFAGPPQVGFVMAVTSAGMLVGSLVMSAWGGPKRRIYGILGFAPVLGVAMIIMGLRPLVPLIAAGSFLLFFVIPFINGSDQALWQTKVAPDVQGRVFAMRRMLSQFTAPISYFIAGPLADRFFEPMLAAGGTLATSVGTVLGTGKGRGIGLQFIVMGAVMVVVALGGFLYPRLRHLEDHVADALEPTPADPIPADPAAVSEALEEGTP